MQRIEKRFGATVALGGVDFEIAPGQVLGLVGENGAGKSTLMKILSGALRPDQGSMQLNGKPYHPRNPLDARQRGVAMIYQELSLAPHLTVAENMMLGIEPARLGFVRRNEMRRRVDTALEQLEHPDIHGNARVSALPIAAQQLVEIARALVSDDDHSDARSDRVIVLDEPTSSLGQADVRRLFGVIQRLRDQGNSIIYISHFIEEVQEVADRYTVLRDGRSVGSGDVADVDAKAIVSMMVGRDVEDLYPRSARTAGDVVLELDSVAGWKKPVSASLTLRKGEVLGIAGLVGAGRTEMLRALFGLDPITHGTVKVATNIGAASPATRWSQGIGMVSEDRKEEGLLLNMSIADNTTLSQLKGLGPAIFVRPSRQSEASQRWIERLAVKCHDATQPVGDLSGGNQQKIAIARLLHHDVDVLLLDEPTRGIDVGSKAHIYQLIDELASKGKAVLIISSYLPELLGVCDRIAVMHRGELGNAKPTEAWSEHSLMLEATGQSESRIDSKPD